MAQKRKPPRLYLRRRGQATTWVIRHGARMICTGFSEAEQENASAVLDAYCAEVSMEPGDPVYSRAFRTVGYIYFATCDFPDFPIKIGWSMDANVRLQSLQCALPYKIRLLGLMPGTIEDERSFHLGYFHTRMEGEWFKRSPELMALIKSCKIREAA